ncbi:MAG TPA: HAD family hydrolase [Anaerolineaceae bacterium]|nr:HAD family hydrolase [Anaerolineaceae bacterium]
MNITKGIEPSSPACNLTQAVFFDLGYTLLNFAGDYQATINESYFALAHALIRAGYPLNANAFVERFNDVLLSYYQSRDEDLIERPVETYLARVLSSLGHTEPPEEVTRAALAEMYLTTESHWQLATEAFTVLQQLQARGCRLGLISNAANADNANRLIDRFDLRGFFKVILISAVEKIRKPDSRIFTRALNTLGLTPERAVMVGDTLTADILGAQNAGLRAVWITTRADHPENTRVRDRINPDAVVQNLSELLPVLQQFHDSVSS